MPRLSIWSSRRLRFGGACFQLTTPTLQQAMSNTAVGYSALGRHAEALDLEEQALAFRRRVLPADHPDIATGHEQLSGQLLCTRPPCRGSRSESRRLRFGGACFQLTTPTLQQAMGNTADSYSALGRHAEALDLIEQTLAFRRRVLPADHPDIAQAMSNTANSYSARRPPCRGSRSD